MLKTMNEQERHDLFAELITRHQSDLYGYIYAVLRNWEDTDDLFQSVCMVLWSKFGSFQPGTNFFAWARQTAKMKISEYLRRRRSPNCLAEKLVDILAETTSDPYGPADAEEYLVALRHCREKLAIEDDELLQLRYVEELSTVEIADRLRRLRQSVSRSLIRIRRWLFECIELELSRQEHSVKKLP
jgi:RNA polymerase sigma-70 factor, ECF subfamily